MRGILFLNLSCWLELPAWFEIQTMANLAGAKSCQSPSLSPTNPPGPRRTYPS